MQKFIRARGAVAAGVGATVAGASFSAPANAREVVHQQHLPQGLQCGVRSVSDGWELADLGADVVLFQKEELDLATDDIAALLGSPQRGPGVVVAELGSDASETSDGGAADEVIRQCEDDGWRSKRPIPLDAESYLALANQLLQRPAMQREMYVAMMTDPGVRRILAREQNRGHLDSYLQGCGIAAAGLLPAPEGLPLEDTEQLEQAEGSEQGGGGSPLEQLARKLVHGLQAAKTKVEQVGSWFMDLLHHPSEADAAQHAEPAADCRSSGGNTSPAAGSGPSGPALGWAGVVVAMVAIVCMVVLRRPL